MSTTACCFDGRPFGKLEREFVCIVCARKVCAEHSSDSRINPFTGERGHACRRCLSETVEGTVESQVASLYRQLHAVSPELKALVAEVQALRHEVDLLRKEQSPRAPVPKTAKGPKVAKPTPKPPKARARKNKSAPSAL